MKRLLSKCLGSASLLFSLSSAALSGNINTEREIKDAAGGSEVHIQYSGEIEVGDFVRLQAAVDRASAGNIKLYLDSPGGSFEEAIKIIRFLLDEVSAIGTVVHDGARCYSACAFIFMAGHSHSEDGYSPPDRTLHLNGKLGFHAPYLELEAPVLSKERVEKAYDFAVAHIASLIELSRKLHLHESDLPRMLRFGKNEFLNVATVDEVGRLRISVALEHPKKYSMEMLNNYCANAYAWKNKSQSRPFRLDDQNGVITNDLLSYSELIRGVLPRIKHRSQLIKSADGQRVRYAIPSSEGPEGSLEFCIIDVFATEEKESLACVGYEMNVVSDEEFKELFSERFRPHTSCDDQPGVYALAPPDTRIEHLANAMQQLVTRSNLRGVKINNVQSTDNASLPSTTRPATSISLSTYENRDLHGGDYQILKNVDLSACSSTCASEKQCIAYSYDKWNRWCFLKEKVGLLRIDPQSISATKIDVGRPITMATELKISRIRNRSFPGKPISERSMPSVESCEQSCSILEKCLVYSFNKRQRICQLFSEAGEYSPNVDIDSGIKRQVLMR